MTESMVQANEAQIDRAVTVTSLSRIGLSDDRSSLLRPSAPRTRPTIPAVLSPQYAEAELATARHGCAGAHTDRVLPCRFPELFGAELWDPLQGVEVDVDQSRTGCRSRPSTRTCPGRS